MWVVRQADNFRGASADMAVEHGKERATAMGSGLITLPNPFTCGDSWLLPSLDYQN